MPIDPTARAAARLIPQSRLIDYEGAPHGTLVTNKADILRDVSAFLAGDTAAKRT